MDASATPAAVYRALLVEIAVAYLPREGTADLRRRIALALGMPTQRRDDRKEDA